jgi:hypothetical protein
MALLKSGVVSKIHRLNYFKTYKVEDNKVVSQNQKLVIFEYDDKNMEKIKQLCSKLLKGYEFISQVH